jgi:hypothetical protein
MKHSTPASTSQGRVIANHDEVFGILCGGETFRATRALSCLVQPEVGDLVLVHSEYGTAYVLAVLSRPKPNPVCLVLPGDAEIRAGGALAIEGDAGVTVESNATIELRSQGLDVRASEGALFIERLSYWGSRAQALVGEVKLCAGALDSAVDRFSQHVKHAFRAVARLDQLRAGRIDYRAEEDVSVRAENATVLTRNLTKIDGKQIHIG